MTTPIEQRFFELHPKSAELHDSARSIFPNGVTHDSRRQDPFQLYYTHAEGAAKYDVDGNRILDYFPGHGALILGHSRPEIVEAVQDQMVKGTHFSGSTELEIEWANWVKELVPSAEKVRFHSSGTEADMMAITHGARLHRQVQGDQVRSPLPRLERLSGRRVRGDRRHTPGDAQHDDRAASQRN